MAIKKQDDYLIALDNLYKKQFNDLLRSPVEYIFTNLYLTGLLIVFLGDRVNKRDKNKQK